MLLVTRSARSEEAKITPVPGWGNDVTFDASGESIGITSRPVKVHLHPGQNPGLLLRAPNHDMTQRGFDIGRCCSNLS